MYGFRTGTGMGAVSALVQTAPPADPTCLHDCTSFWNWMLFPCCADAAVNWETIQITGNAYEGLPSTPAPSTMPAPVGTAANPTPLTTPPADQSTAQGTVDATITAGQTAQQTQAQSFFADLSNWTNAGCSSSILSGVCDSTVFIAGAIAAAGLLFMFAGGGGRRR